MLLFASLLNTVFGHSIVASLNPDLPFSPSTTRILFNSKFVNLAENNQFLLEFGAEKVYDLQIFDTNYQFERLLVVKGDDEIVSAYRVGLDFSPTFKYESMPKVSLSGINPVAKMDYFQQRAAFSIFSILGNPMILMSGVSLGILFLLPNSHVVSH